jgi:hypothetical protein
MISRDVSAIGSFSFSSSIGPAFYPADDAACRSRPIAGTDAGGISSKARRQHRRNRPDAAIYLKHRGKIGEPGLLARVGKIG